MRFLPAAFVLAPVLAFAQAPPEPESETIRSEGQNYIETIHAQRAGWVAAGSRPRDYRMGTGPVPGALEQAAFVIASRPDAHGGLHDFGTLMQMHAPGPFLGKRLRMSARLKTDSVRRGQMWLRADYAGGVSHLCNMEDRPVRDTADWQRYELVMDVPEKTDFIAYGFFVAGGKGTAWMDGLTLEVVDKTVPVTERGCSMSQHWY